MSSSTIGENLPCPPCNIGPRSTPDYHALAAAAVHSLPSGEVVFAGQRNDAVLRRSRLDLRPRRPAAVPEPPSDPDVGRIGRRCDEGANVHTIAIQVPIADLTADGSVPKDPMSTKSVLGIWGAASRRKVRLVDAANGEQSRRVRGSRSRAWATRCSTRCWCRSAEGPWNASQPSDDAQFADGVKHPELATLLPVLYPGVFPNLAALSAAASRPRRDPAHRDPRGDRPGVPEQHRVGARRHAAPQRGDSAGV